MALDHFTAVTDFAVRVTDTHLIEYVSGSHGRIAWFPAWEHADRDLRHFVPSDVPLGTFNEPFVDEDEGWRITIFEHAGWVYIEENGTHHRVPVQQYIEAWARVINHYNPVAPL